MAFHTILTADIHADDDDDVHIKWKCKQVHAIYRAVNDTSRWMCHYN